MYWALRADFIVVGFKTRSLALIADAFHYVSFKLQERDRTPESGMLTMDTAR